VEGFRTMAERRTRAVLSGVKHSFRSGSSESKAAVRARALRKLGYEVTITPINQLAVRVAVHV